MTAKAPSQPPSALALARQRASKALRNARQRCSNPKNPDYRNYGAEGIEVRFANVSELIASIGVPPPGQSLDRIDPHGHYEAGNVRWASPAVQAANKKAAALNYHLSDTAMIQKAKLAVEEREARKKVAIAWIVMRGAYNRGYLKPAEAAALAERLAYPGVLEANFDFNTIADFANDAPGFIHLPALSMPDARVRLRALPPVPSLDEHGLNKRGRLAVLEGLNPEWNVPTSVWKWALEATVGGSGLVLQGKATPQALLGGWIEGTCLALASCLPVSTGCTASFFPMLKAVHELKEIGSQWSWDDVTHPLLDDDVIMIPDFALDCGSWGEMPAEGWRVSSLLAFRAERQRSTIIGVASLGKLPAVVRDLVLGGFRVLKMPAMPPHSTADLKFAQSCRQLEEGAKTLRSLAHDPSSSHLVTSFE